MAKAPSLFSAAATPEDEARTNAALHQTWMKEIDAARLREKDYRKEAARCVRIYEADSKEKTPFAILYSNTETLSPALYNSPPVPMVERRFRDADPLGKAAADVGTRSLKFLIEAESADYDSFDELMQPAVTCALVTNRGLTRFRYHADVVGGKVKSECVYGEDVRYDKFLHGYARTWKKVPWGAFEWDMNEDEWKANFPDAPLDFKALPEVEDDPTDQLEKRDLLKEVKLAKVYEIWDKAKRQVIFLSPAWPKGPLKPIIPDPLGLASFFPTPKPLNFMRKISTMVPTPLYIQYEAQAKELNQLTTRLKHLIEACKIRGFYNSTVEGIEKVLTAEDNDLIPVENMASMPDGMGVDKMIWLMPLDTIVTAVQMLYQQREACKQVIYEITGVSDILRGATQASETATAQNIKNQWGTLRLKKMQKEVQRYCRDSLRIILEIAATKFSPETFAAMTGLPFPTAAAKKQAQAMMQAYQQMAAMAQQQAQAPQVPGQPPASTPQPPPPPPPEVQTAASAPSWEEILDLLKNDLTRSYRVDIETNSTIDAEATQDKQDIAELLNSISQFLNGVAPLVENGSMPFDVAKSILLAISRRFTFGSQLEDSLEKMKPPEPKADPAAEAKAQSEQLKAQTEDMKTKAEMARLQLEAQIAQQTFQNEQALAAQELEIKKAELAIRKEELVMERASLIMKAEAAAIQHKQKMEASEHQHKTKMKEPTRAAV